MDTRKVDNNCLDVRIIKEWCSQKGYVIKSIEPYFWQEYYGAVEPSDIILDLINENVILFATVFCKDNMSTHKAALQLQNLNGIPIDYQTAGTEDYFKSGIRFFSKIVANTTFSHGSTTVRGYKITLEE